MEAVLYVLLPTLVISAPRVTCPWGRVDGVDVTSREGQLYYGYYGIPYAKPPTGELRFHKPVPHPGVSEVFNASTYGPKCLQITAFDTDKVNDTSMNEDCLTLNVFLPNATLSSSRKSVMIWIHGGAWQWGDARSYEPWMLVTKGDVIVVTIQYRLGVFGFLSTGSDVSPGNYGLWDQHLAIKWVKDNIRSFGGDTSSISIIGESAGSASVAYHLLYPDSKGLFNRAVLQSGAATSIWALDRNITKFTEQLSTRLGCTQFNKEETLKCLRSKDSRQLLRSSYFRRSMVPELIEYPWIPCVDGVFVVDEPQTLMQDEIFLNTTAMTSVDVMLGLNNNEGAYPFFIANMYDQVFGYNYSTDLLKQSVYEHEYIPKIAEMSLGKHDPKINDVIDEIYSSGPYTSLTVPKDQMFITYGDPAFLAPSVLFLRSHAKMAHSRKCFFYFFNHFPSFTGSNPIKGILHGLDTVYLFDLSNATVRLFGNTGDITEDEYELSDTFVKFIAEFVKQGDPNGIIEAKLGKKWPQFNRVNQQYLSFTTNMSTGRDLYTDRVKLWLTVLPNLAARWSQSANEVTTTPNEPITAPPPGLFGLEPHTAEIAILTLIAVLSVTLVALVIVSVCWCCRRKKTPKEKYDVR